MTRSEKIKAEKKIDVALCKLQDLYYINPKGIESSRISSRLTTALDAIRELQYEVENTPTK